MIQERIERIEPTCIHFKDLNPTYYPGDTVTGIIGLTVHRDIQVNSMKLSYEGKTSVFWNNAETNNIHYYGEINLCDSDGVKILARGEHTFPFSFKLPEGVPASYNGPFGMITHSASVKITRPMAGSLSENKEFQVTKTNGKIEMRPGKYMGLGAIKRMFDTPGLVELIANLPSKMIFAETRTSFNVIIKNHENRKIKKLRVKLIRYDHLHSVHQETPCERLFNCIDVDYKTTQSCIHEVPAFTIDVPIGYQKEYEIQMEIPKVATPSLKTSLITVSYVFAIKLKTSGGWFGRSAEFRFPIEIGVKERDGKEVKTVGSPPPYKK